MSSNYAHDADVIVYNYKLRVTESAVVAALNKTFSAGSPMDTEEISLRDAITSITCSKTKSAPQGTFSITLKPTREWTKILVPGSWCAIYMSNKPLGTSDLNNSATVLSTTRVESPLKMVGIIMAVRVQKQRSSEGAYSMVYTVNGYDFGYVFTSSIYINHVLQAEFAAGKFDGVFSGLSFPKDGTTYANPAINVQRVLQGWSVLSNSLLPSGAGGSIQPPDIRMEIPQAVANLIGTGTEVLQLVSAAIGVDKRSEKVFPVSSDGESKAFEFELVGEKRFMLTQLIVHNTLWNMINEYLNPLLNEAYCDLHVCSFAGGVGPLPGGPKIKPCLIVRQIPFNTPSYEALWEEQKAKSASNLPPYKVTRINEIPRTVVPAEKVVSYDVGYSEYERCNFIEVNGFVIDGPKAGSEIGAFNLLNRPTYENGAVKRFGLRPKVFHGVDYGVTKSRLDQAGSWRPLMVDWWFNGNKYVNGTIECIGLSEHIAIGGNFELTQEKLLGHIEGYTHTFTVDAENGLKTFRTSIEFVKGIGSDSTSKQFKYIYGDASFGNDLPIPKVNGILGKQESSSFEDDVQQRSTFTSTSKQGAGSGSIVGTLKGKFGL